MENKKIYDANGNEIVVTEQDFQLTQVDKKIHDVKFETKTTTYAKDAFRRFCKNKSSVVAAIIISILLLIALILPEVSPYDIDTVHPEESLLGPKIKDPVQGSWNDTWNGTVKYTEISYDPVAEAPIGNFREEAIVAIEVKTQTINRTNVSAYGGTFIFADDITNRRSTYVPYLSLYDTVNYNASDNFTLNMKLAELDLTNEADLQGYNEHGQYRIILEHGQINPNSANGDRLGTGERIVVSDWSSQYGDVSFNLSNAIAQAGLTEVIDGRILIELQRVEGKCAYIAIESLEITSTTTNQDILKKLEDISMDDANGKLLIGKTNAGIFSPGYWRSNAVKTVYHAQLMKCNFLYDEYEAVYGLKQTDKITENLINRYIENGMCEYDYEIGPSSFIRLSEECPIVEITKQTEIMDSKTGLYSALQFEGTVYNYLLLGHESAPKYLLGTTKSGFDIITVSFNGLRTSMLLSITVSAICLTFGLCWGAISGYFGGTVDIVMERFCEILSGVPWIVVMTLTILLLGNNIITFGIAVCLTGWMGAAARTRTQFYRFKRSEYILASRTLGASDMRLIFRHILPNGMGTIITGSILSIPGVIFSEATLSFLGLLSIRNTFGIILAENQQYTNSHLALIIFPTVIISLIMISFNLFGNGLRDALNPSLKGSE